MSSRARNGDLLRLTVGGSVFAVGAAIAHWSAPTAFEIAVFHRVNDLTDLLRIPAETVMTLGTLLGVVIVTAVALTARRYRMALCAIVAGIVGNVVSHFMRELVGRDRPLDLLHHVVVRGPRIVGAGYPSGHTTTAAALVAAVTPFLSRRLRTGAWVAAVLVALARVYVGAHLPLDVVGGFALGVALGAVVHLVLGPRAPAADAPRVA